MSSFWKCPKTQIDPQLHAKFQKTTLHACMISHHHQHTYACMYLTTTNIDTTICMYSGKNSYYLYYYQ